MISREHLVSSLRSRPFVKDMDRLSVDTFLGAVNTFLGVYSTNRPWRVERAALPHGPTVTRFSSLFVQYLVQLASLPRIPPMHPVRFLSPLHMQTPCQSEKAKRRPGVVLSTLRRDPRENGSAARHSNVPRQPLMYKRNVIRTKQK